MSVMEDFVAEADRQLARVLDDWLNKKLSELRSPVWLAIPKTIKAEIVGKLEREEITIWEAMQLAAAEEKGERKND